MQEVDYIQNNGNELPEILISEKQKKTPVTGIVFNDNIIKKKMNLISQINSKIRKKSVFPESTEFTKTLSKKRLNIQNSIEECIQVEQFIPFSIPVIETVIHRKSPISKSAMSKQIAPSTAVKIVKDENQKPISVDFDIGNNTDLETVYEKEFTHFPRGLQWRRKENQINGIQEGGLKANEGGNEQEKSTESRLKFLR